MSDHLATHRFAADHPAAAGHFPGNPIIPGAVVLRQIVAAISLDRDTGCRIRSAKFHTPIRPGDTVEIAWSEAIDGDIRFTCSLLGSNQPAVTGLLRWLPP